MFNRLFNGTITFFELVKGTVITLVVLIVAIVFIGLPILVSGLSMEPNFHDKEIVLVSRFSYNNNPIKRGDVVAAKFPADAAKTRLIKRVIGLPGETVSFNDSQFSINNQPLAEPYKVMAGEAPYDVLRSVVLKENEYYLAGDNRPGSSDSRLWGAVQKSDIQGRVVFVIWPIPKMRYIVPVTYR